MPPEDEQIESTPAEFESSGAFRNTMSSVMSGVRDEGKLRQQAVDDMKSKPLTASELEADESGKKKELDPVPDKPEGSDDPDLDKPDADKPEPKKDEGKKPGSDGEEQEEVETLTRDDLRKSLSPKKGKTDEKEPDALDPKGEEKKPDDDPLRGEYPADPERFRKRVNNYERLISESETREEAFKTQIDELTKKAEQVGKIPEDVENQLTELKQYRRRYAIETDPTYVEKFQTRINESNELVDEALQSINITEKTRTMIKEAGGLSAFLRSNQKVTVHDNKGKTVQIEPSEFLNLALDKMNKKAPDAEATVRAELAQQRRINSEKTKFIEKETQEADKYFEKLEAETAQTQEMIETQEAELEKVMTTFKATVHAHDWMKEEKLPENPTPEQQKEIRAENSFRKKLRNLFDSQLNMDLVREAAKRATKQEELNEFATILVDAARVFHVERELSAAEKRIASLEKELDSVRKAGSRSTPDRRSTGGRTAVDISGEPKPDQFDSPLKYAIELNRWQKANGIKVES